MLETADIVAKHRPAMAAFLSGAAIQVRSRTHPEHGWLQSIEPSWLNEDLEYRPTPQPRKVFVIEWKDGSFSACKNRADADRMAGEPPPGIVHECTIPAKE